MPDSPRPTTRHRAIRRALGALALVCTLAAAAIPARAQFGLELAAVVEVLREILGTNHRLVRELEKNTAIASEHLDLDSELSDGFRNALPQIIEELTKDYRDEAVGYIERELGPLHQIMREGKVSRTNRKEYELAFGAVPDTPHLALAQLVVDDTAVMLLTKAGENVRLIKDLRREWERLNQEKRVSPRRAEQLTRQQALVLQKIDTLTAELNAYRAQAEAVDLATRNQFRKAEAASQLQTARELADLCRTQRPFYEREGRASGRGGFAHE